MTTHAFICTRTREVDPIHGRLLDYLEDARVNVWQAIGASSMFDGYLDCAAQAGETLDPEDVVVLCHDDVNVLSSKYIFECMVNAARAPQAGFVGVIGSTVLPVDGSIRSGNPRGIFFLGESHKKLRIFVGDKAGPVVILDGIFLMVQWKKLCEVGLQAPEYLPNGWHYYDIHYTYRARQLGYVNHTYPLFVQHSAVEKPGTGFDEAWEEARRAFVAHHKIPEGGVHLREREIVTDVDLG